MKINRNNYEIYFLDYHEGNLSAQKQAELFLFLEQHPDLKNEFESFDLVKLPSADISFEEKDTLKRELITKENYQQYLIANLEGDLNEDEKHELNKFLFRHPEYKREEKLFTLTKLVPEDAIVYPAKSELKRAIPVSAGNRKAFYYSIAAAACVLLLTGVYFLKQNSNEKFRANNEIKKEISPVVKNNSPVENAETSSYTENKKENISTDVKKIVPEVKALNESKSVLANTVSVEKKEKRLQHKKTHDEKTLAEKKIKFPELNEPVNPIGRKEIARVELKEAPQQQIAFININLLKGELNNSTALNTYLDRITDPGSKNFSSNPSSTIGQNKQQQKPVLNFFAWALSAFSKKEVVLKKRFNAEGEMVAYQLEAGRFKIGKSSDH